LKEFPTISPFSPYNVISQTIKIKKKKKKKLNIIIVKKEGGLIEKMVWTWKLHLEMGPKWQER
jgi:hypothetical protein